MCTIAYRILTACLPVLFACSITAFAQSGVATPPTPKTTIPADKRDSSDNEPTLGPIEEEMRVKRLIKLEEKQYQENLSRAREAAALSSELRNSYEQKKTLTREDAKKLERLEKLTKKIRGEAGGSDEDALLDNPPHELESALGKLADVADSLSKVVEKTPRQVISAVVIEQANVVLQLVKITRNLFH